MTSSKPRETQRHIARNRGASAGSSRSGTPPKGRKPAHAQPPQVVRILGGQWKRTPLPVADAPGLRPTPSRVRETLFNWLGQDLSGLRCVDAFSGTGALGLEAASRGAAEVLLLERSPALLAQLRRTVAQLHATQVRVVGGDALAALRGLAGQGWDVVFLDPPFAPAGNGLADSHATRKGGGKDPVTSNDDADQSLANDSLYRHALQAAAQAVSAQGLAHLESPRLWPDGELAALGWTAVRRGKAGAVHHSLLRRTVPGAEVAAAEAAIVDGAAISGGVAIADELAGAAVLSASAPPLASAEVLVAAPAST